MNLTAQFLNFKLDIAALQRVKFYVRMILLFTFLYLVRALAIGTSGFTTGPSLCVFRNLTGLLCPFCGTTRSIGNILLGNFDTALRLNFFGYLSLLFFILLLLSPSTIKRLSDNLAKKWWELNQRNQISISLSIFALAWLFNLPRLL